MNKIPLMKVFMPPKEQLMPELEKILYSGMITEGEKVKEFEEAFKKKFALNTRPFSVNSGTSALQLAYRCVRTNDKFKNIILTTPMTCLSSRSSILLSDGTTRQIGKIVNNKEQLYVKSYNEATGKIEDKKITNWIKKEVTEDWYRISFEDASVVTGNQKKGTYVTGDHEVLTQRGWIKVKNLLEEDFVATNHPVLNNSQEDVITGTMLGDAHIQEYSKTKSKNCRITFTHTESKKEWVKVKAGAFKGYRYNIVQKKPRYATKSAVCFLSSTSLQWKKLHKKWYKEGKKIVPRDLRLTPITLATWFMDDGCLNSNDSVLLCTEGFLDEDVFFLKRKLEEMGFIVSTVKRKSGLQLYIGNGLMTSSGNIHNSARKFYQMIAAYVVPCMRYKLPEEFKCIEYNPDLWRIDSCNSVFFSKVTAEKTELPKSEVKNYCYCVEVEDNHNFISSEMVLHNCFANVCAAVNEGYKIVWCDIDPATGNICPKDVERKLDYLGDTVAAVSFVDLGGFPADRNNLYNAVANRVPLIQDAAQSLGSKWENFYAGADPAVDFTAFSFQAIKHLTTIDGGMLSVSPAQSEEIHSKARKLKWFGIPREAVKEETRWNYDIPEPGFKFHMNNVNATIGLVQLDFVDKIIRRHKENGDWYNKNLQNVEGIKLPYIPPFAEPSYWIYPLRVEKREEFAKMMTSKGIGVNIAHVRNDSYACMKGSKFAPLTSDLPGMDEYEKEYIFIPSGWWVTPKDREYIADTIKQGW